MESISRRSVIAGMSLLTCGCITNNTSSTVSVGSVGVERISEIQPPDTTPEDRENIRFIESPSERSITVATTVVSNGCVNRTPRKVQPNENQLLLKVKRSQRELDSGIRCTPTFEPIEYAVKVVFTTPPTTGRVSFSPPTMNQAAGYDVTGKDNSTVKQINVVNVPESPTTKQ